MDNDNDLDVDFDEDWAERAIERQDFACWEDYIDWVERLREDLDFYKYIGGWTELVTTRQDFGRWEDVRTEVCLWLVAEGRKNGFTIDISRDMRINITREDDKLFDASENIRRLQSFYKKFVHRFIGDLKNQLRPFECVDYWSISGLAQEWNDDIEILRFVNKFLHPQYSILDHASPRLKDNKDFVLENVKRHGLDLQYASPRLRRDIETVITAVRQSCDGDALEYAPEDLRGNSVFLIQLLKASANFCSESQFLYHATDEIKGDKEFMMEAMGVEDNYSVYGSAFRFADDTLKDDIDVVSLAVQKDGLLLEYASPRLQDNRRIVSLVVHEKSDSIMHASPRLRNDFHVALAAVRGMWFEFNPIEYVSDPLQHNIDIVTSSELTELELPPTNILLNNHQNQQTLSLFPYFLERANQCPIIIYYLLQNRHVDLIPESVPPIAHNKKKRKRSD